ncbi:NUDIX hydrolase [Paenibacillus dakarensis]|uniref:NUDIX hydrolase n=1 Tax=Paenibacillus dakarensis TaxID=1527293 RepID=UPI0006D59DE6|nr:NUDIX hydrolase [Paenibacillus dakarensis]
MDTPNIKEFPTLSHSIDWGIVKADFTFTNTVEEALISNVSIIPCVGNKYVIFQIDNGMWELPGGTLEPGEGYMDALRREVMEELGGELITYEVIGQFDCESSAEKPYKPHIPHPKFVRIVGYGEVNLVGKPLNPVDGEQVISVETVDIEEAINRFEEIDRHDIAELYKLVDLIRN